MKTYLRNTNKLHFLIFGLSFILVLIGGCKKEELPNHDTDGDNLIEVTTLSQLNAIRHDLNGDGKLDFSDEGESVYADAFPGIDSTSNSSYKGYELMNDLDFTDSK